MKSTLFALTTAIALSGIAAMPANANLQVGAAFAIIPQGGGDLVHFPHATFTNTDLTIPIFLTGASNLTFHGDFGPAQVTDFTLATDISNAGGTGLEIAPGATLNFTGENGNPGLLVVSDDGNDPTRYKSGLHYTATYNLTYHSQGAKDTTITGIPIDFVYTPDFRAVPEPGAYALFGSMALAGSLFLKRRRAR